MKSGSNLVWGLVSLCFALVIGLMVLGGLRDATTTNSLEYNTTRTVITSLSGGATWIGILVVVGFAALVYGFVQIFRGAGGE